MLELVIRDAPTGKDLPMPRVEKLDGPRVRLTIAPEQPISVAIQSCRAELLEAVEWAITELYKSDEIPSRIYVRNANEAAVMVDPCAIYGLQAIVRAEDL